MLKHKSNYFTSLLQSIRLLTISSQLKLEALTEAYKALYYMVLLPLWSHFLFLLPHALHSTPHMASLLFPQHARHAPTWHLPVPSAWNVLLSCMHAAPSLLSFNFLPKYHLLDNWLTYLNLQPQPHSDTPDLPYSALCFSFYFLYKLFILEQF